MSGHGCLPSAAQERLLRACFAPDETAAAEFEAWRSEADLDSADPVELRFLPLLDRRWKGRIPDYRAAEASRRIQLPVWRQNLEQIQTATRIRTNLNNAGVSCMFLKGLALLVRHYRQTGLRSMGDVDLLIHGDHIKPALEALTRDGWQAEGAATIPEILREARVRHAWQFNRGSEECDLHWRPMARGYSPEIARSFWEKAETVPWRGSSLEVPSPTEQLFHVCVHGMQWTWNAELWWAADALTILRIPGEIDWERLRRLAAAAGMTQMLVRALRHLEDRFGASIPPSSLAGTVIRRGEEREFALLQKPCPLGLKDSIAWHVTNFQRLRKFDAEWSRRSAWIGFAGYLKAFLNASSAGEALRALSAEVGKRLGRP